MHTHLWILCGSTQAERRPPWPSTELGHLFTRHDDQADSSDCNLSGLHDSPHSVSAEARVTVAQVGSRIRCRLALFEHRLYVIDTYTAETYMELTMTRLQTVVELPEFQRRAKAIMSDQEREAAIDFIATNPEAGVSLGGGLRKVRIPREGGGKSGGFRTVYVFGGTHMPIFLITVFAKNEKANLSKTEQAAAVEMSKTLVAKYGDAT